MDVTPSKYPPLPNRRSLTPRKSHFTSSTPSKYSPGNGDGMMRSSYGGDIDYHLLDYKQPYEFLNKYYVPGEERALLEQITYQLKLSRNLLQISTIIMNTDINSDIIQQIIDCSQVLLDAEKVIFASMDKNGDLLINGSDGLVTINSGIEYDTSKTQRGIILNEVSNDTRINTGIYRALNIVPRNVICYPTINSDRASLGLLLVINKLSVNSSFSQLDLWSLEYVSSYVATALLMKQSVTQEQESLNQPSQNLSTCSQLPSLYPPKNSVSFFNQSVPKLQQSSTIELCIEQLINNAYHILRADKISLFLPNETSQQLVCTISRDIKGMQVSMDEGVVGQTLKSKVPIHSRNVRENTHHSNSVDNLTGYNTVSLLSYPILSKNGNHVLGVIQAINKQDGEDFSQEDSQYFSNLSAYISELLSNQGDHHSESMTLNIMKAIGDYSYASAYNYRAHIYDSLQEFNEVRIQELISYCKLICSTDLVLMYSLQSTSNTITLTTQFENDVFLQSDNIGLELKYLESLAKDDSTSIANPSSGEYGSVYTMPSYRDKNIPSSVLRAIQQNRIIQITKNRQPISSSGSETSDMSDQSYLQSVNSTAAIIIPIRLISYSSLNNSTPRRDTDSPLDVLIILKTIGDTSSSSPSPSYLYNVSLDDFTIYQLNGIQCLLKIFNSTYQLSIAHREELFQQSILENQVEIMNETLIQLDTMYCLVSGDGLLKLYNPSFEDFLGVPDDLLESISQSQIENMPPMRIPGGDFKLLDMNLESLLPSDSIGLINSFKEAIRSGKVTCAQNVLLKTFKYPDGVHVNYEIYEYYGHHTHQQQQQMMKLVHQHTPTNSTNKKSKSKKSLSKLESFHFDNYSSPLEERKFTGRTGKLYRICLKYVDKGNLHDVIQSNSKSANDFPSSIDDSPLSLEHQEDSDCLVLHTKNTILNTPPIKSRSHFLSDSSPCTSPRSPLSPRGNILTPSNTSKLSQLSVLFSFEFNSLEVTSPEHQKQYAILLFEKNINLTEMNIPKSYFYSLISDIELNYYSNPFHNFQHALCVLQFFYMLLEITNYPPLSSNTDHHRMSHQRRPYDVIGDDSATLYPSSPPYHHLIPHNYLYLSALLSALSHDIRHPGNTNLYEIHSQSSRALLYNDQSVLENYHCSTTFHLLNQSKNNIFLNYSLHEKLLIRKIMISCILATDMSQHSHLIHQIYEKQQLYSKEISCQDYVSIIQMKEEELLFYCKILLHAADLSNPIRPFIISKRWAELVSEEFNEQGKKEQHYNLPVSTFLLSPTLDHLVNNEIYFSNQIVLPLWKSLERYFPMTKQFHLFVEQIHHNTIQWRNLSSATTTSTTTTTSTSTTTTADLSHVHVDEKK